jgi:sugar phosphate isomerase/epimerase
MRLGATIDAYGVPNDPESYVRECRQRRYSAAPCPRLNIRDSAALLATRNAFAAADVVIAEVQAWVNPLDLRPEHRRRNLNTIAESLAIADEVGAVCCVTVAGTFDASENAQCDSYHPDNFSRSAHDGVVEWVRQVLAEVNPLRTKLTLEISPWTFLDGPEAYNEILHAVDDPRLGVHLDPVNAICTARIYCDPARLINRCFDLLGSRVIACHAKDIRQGAVRNQVNLEETAPGRGVMDYKAFLNRIEMVSTEMPLLIEHLRTPEQYEEAATFLRATAAAVGARS